MNRLPQLVSIDVTSFLLRIISLLAKVVPHGSLLVEMDFHQFGC